MLFVAGQTPDQIAANVADFNAIRASRGLPPNAPRVVFLALLRRERGRGAEGFDWAIAFGREAGGHYQFLDPSNAARFNGPQRATRTMPEAPRPAAGVCRPSTKRAPRSGRTR
jgi:hypothetical protein